MAIAVLTPHQICPGPDRDEDRITNGRFDLVTHGDGSVVVFLDMNGNGIYERHEPDWFHASSSVTPAEFDAQRDFHIEITGVPEEYGHQTVNIAFCTPEVFDASPEGVDCHTLRYGWDRSAPAFAADGEFWGGSAFTVWLADAEPPIDWTRPHYVGSLTNPPCTTEGDLTSCLLSFRDFVVESDDDAGVSR